MFAARSTSTSPSRARTALSKVSEATAGVLGHQDHHHRGRSRHDHHRTALALVRRLAHESERTTVALAFMVSGITTPRPGALGTIGFEL